MRDPAGAATAIDPDGPLNGGTAIVAKCGAGTRVGGKRRKNATSNPHSSYHNGKSSAARAAEPAPFPVPHKAARIVLRHGIYAAALVVAIGNLDGEIALARIQLRRILIAMGQSCGEQHLKAAGARSTPTFASREEATFTADAAKYKVETAKRRPDYHALMGRWLGRIAQLERARFEIGRGQGSNAADTAVLLEQPPPLQHDPCRSALGQDGTRQAQARAARDRGNELRHSALLRGSADARAG